MKGQRIRLKTVLALLTCFMILISAFGTSSDGATVTQTKVDLDPLLIPKYINQLDGPPPVFVPTTTIDPASGELTDYYSIVETEFLQQMLPRYDQYGIETGFPMTPVWGYGGIAKDALTGQPLGFVRSTPSPTIESTRYTPANVAWINGIFTPYVFAADSTIDPVDDGGDSSTSRYPVTTTVHLHGGETQANYDGHPESWTSWNGLHGPDYETYARSVPNAAVYHYDNDQSPGTLWFHDRAVGMTRSNAYSGLSGFYIIRDPGDPISQVLPSGKYDMPLSIQDRNFYTDGTLKLPTENKRPPSEPAYWVGEFFGDVVVVNGKVWPNMNVDRGQYLFRVLDSSNSRWFDISMSNLMPFVVIAKDGEYLRNPVSVTSLSVAPGERYDILMDFSSYAPGTKIRVTNSASAPYPNGAPADPDSNGRIMQFTVGEDPGFSPNVLPGTLNRFVDDLSNVDGPLVERTFTLFDFVGERGDSNSLLDGQLFRSPMSELPLVGSTEIWRIVDSTDSSHIIRISLASMLLVSRQGIDVDAYDADWLEINGGRVPYAQPTRNLNLTGYLQGEASGPLPVDRVWGDSMVVHPGEVVTFLVRFAPVDGRESFGFDPTEGPSYIWYSHILDHEEDEMMRQFRLVLE